MSDFPADKDLVVLASETISALISSKNDDMHLGLSFDDSCHYFKSLFTYIFFQIDHPENKDTFIKELNKWFSSSENRSISLYNNVILTLLLREDLKLNLDEKIIQALKDNPTMEIFIPSKYELNCKQKDLIWKSFDYDSLNKKVSELIQKIVLFKELEGR